jgi:hypothetical protein
MKESVPSVLTLLEMGKLVELQNVNVLDFLDFIKISDLVLLLSCSCLEIVFTYFYVVSATHHSYFSDRRHITYNGGCFNIVI